MYPIEYTWMSVAMPVTKIAIVIESGSTRKATSTLQIADGKPLPKDLRELPFLVGLVDQAGEHDQRDDERQAHHCRREPARGGFAELAPEDHEQEEAGERERRDEPDEVEHSAPHQGDVVGRGRRLPAQDRHDDAEADDDLGGRHHEHEEHDGLPGDVVELRGERDEREVRLRSASARRT